MLLVSSLCLFEFSFSVQFCNKQKHSSKTSSETLVCQSYNLRDHPRLVRQEGPQKSNKDVGMSGRVHAVFLFLTLWVFCLATLAHSWSQFPLSGSVQTFQAETLHLEHQVVCPFIVLSFFASSASLYFVVSHAGCKNLKKKKVGCYFSPTWCQRAVSSLHWIGI